MLFSLPFFRVEVMRQLRNPYTLVFSLGMPVAMYLLFGTGLGYGGMSAGNGNVSFYVMVSMAAFGTATAMTSLCSLAASEVGQGWGRQLAMTPMTTAGYAVVKVITALCFAALSTAAVFLAGALTGAEADDAWRWAASAGIVLSLGLIYGLYGLGVGLSFNSDSAAALASITITFFGFLGNAFMPLEGGMLEFAKFTPLYGYVSLARWPITEGALMAGGSDPLWMVLLNVAVWTAVFVVLVRFGVLRSRRRR
jgi:ABC-2 type transport system permease protein